MMRKDHKYNRLTWQRKEKIGKHHPKYYKDMLWEMYTEQEDLDDDESEAIK